MTHLFEIAPHHGVGPVRLGMPRAEAREALRERDVLFLWNQGEGLSRSREGIDYFCDHALQLGIAGDGTVEFIGLAHSRHYVARYKGADVFDTPARKLFELAAQADGSGVHTFTNLDYLFPNQILTLHDADRQYDHVGEARGGGRSRPIWGQIGIGNRAYYEAVAGKPWRAANHDDGAERYVHAKFGHGTLIARSGSGDNETLELRFDDGVVRKLRSKFVVRANGGSSQR